MIEWAYDQAAPLEIRAGGSKRALGRPPRTQHTLHLDRLTGIIDYEPSELVITAHAATPTADITALLEASNQTLAFEPPDWSALLGPGRPTLGGTIATNAAGPRRVRAGAPRDHFLGFAAINGRGEAWKSGGKVVKNVTGYDMCKLQAGAFGTLSVLTELSVRVVPKPETACTLLFPGLTDEAAIALMARALNTEHEVSAAAHLATRSITVIRVEGHAPSVAYRTDALEALLGRADRLDHAETTRLWTDIAAARPLLETAPDRLVWRLCPTPSAAPAAITQIRRTLPSAEALYDWAGGLVWLTLDPTDIGTDAGAATIRAAIAQAGGHATLFRAPDAIRATIPVFDPEPGPLAALSNRIKTSLDPNRILNPGRTQESR
jgi:glycolate oxidase FAD binding subunit